MKVRFVTCVLVGLTMFSGPAMSCGAGPISSASFLSKVKQSVKKAVLQIPEVAAVRAIILIKKYVQLAKDGGDTPESHRKAAYQWGYEVGNPVVIAAFRTGGEALQGLYYTTMYQSGRDTTYNPVTWAYWKDSWGDLTTSVQGARDKQAGRDMRSEYK